MLWNKPTPWLMLLLVLGKKMYKPKFRVKQSEWNQVIHYEAKCVLMKEFLERGIWTKS